MHVIISLGILSILCCLSCTIEAADRSREAAEFDYLMLVREWPFTFCTVNTGCKNKNRLQSKFNIHGLWAESNVAVLNGEPMFCKNTTFNYSELAPLMHDLMQNWMDLRDPGGSPKLFWQQEFKKHGSCVATDTRFSSTYLFFLGTLKLHLKYNLTDMLANSSLVPGSNQINSNDIREAFRKSFGFNAGVRCSKKNGVVYLYELRLCFTKDLQPRDCDEQPERPERPELQLRDFPWILRRLYALASRLLGGRDFPGRSSVPAPNYQGRKPSPGTYSCHDGEMVLLPDSV